jgi:hypothetical protein
MEKSPFILNRQERSQVSNFSLINAVAQFARRENELIKAVSI